MSTHIFSVSNTRKRPLLGLFYNNISNAILVLFILFYLYLYSFVYLLFYLSNSNIWLVYFRSFYKLTAESKLGFEYTIKLVVQGTSLHLEMHFLDIVKVSDQYNVKFN